MLFVLRKKHPEAKRILWSHRSLAITWHLCVYVCVCVCQWFSLSYLVSLWNYDSVNYRHIARFINHTRVRSQAFQFQFFFVVVEKTNKTMLILFCIIFVHDLFFCYKNSYCFNWIVSFKRHVYKGLSKKQFDEQT